MVFHRDGIILWLNLGNDMRNICLGPILVIVREIFVRVQNNFWGLYEYFLVSGQMKLRHVTCDKNCTSTAPPNYHTFVRISNIKLQ